MATGSKDIEIRKNDLWSLHNFILRTKRKKDTVLKSHVDKSLSGSPRKCETYPFLYFSALINKVLDQIQSA